jgi:FKBP-type peptidyl-prolyl cis-trans isomerase FklB
LSSRALAVAALALLLAGWRSASPDALALVTPEERFSYGMGAKLGEDLRNSGHTLDRALLLHGIEDGLAGTVALSKEELAAALQTGVEKQQEERAAQLARRALAAREEGRAFLVRNRERSGVVELPSGVQYEVLHEGSGPTPTLEDFVTCNSRGALLDGTVFDDTAALGRPRTFAVTSVIDGLEEVLLRMQMGARWKIYVPSELGYGVAGARSKVPPNSTLIFELELLAIEPSPRG